MAYLQRAKRRAAKVAAAAKLLEAGFKPQHSAQPSSSSGVDVTAKAVVNAGAAGSNARHAVTEDGNSNKAGSCPPLKGSGTSTTIAAEQSAC